MHIHDGLHGLGIGEIDVMEEAATQEGVGQLFLVVGGDDHDRALLGADGFPGLVDEELHAIQFLQKVIGELDVGLVDLVDQQHHLAVMGKGFPQLAFFQVVGHIFHPFGAELGVTQARHRIVLVQALLGLGGGFDIPGEQRQAQGLGHLFCQQGLAGTRLTLDQQRALEGDRCVNGHFQVVGGHILVSTLKLHETLHTKQLIERVNGRHTLPAPRRRRQLPAGQSPFNAGSGLQAI